MASTHGHGEIPIGRNSMLLEREETMSGWLDKQILFFGGKGGVGKTTLASAHAVKASESGKKVLLVSTDPAHNTGDIFGTEIGHKEKEIMPNLWALEIDPHHESHRYINKVKDNLK